MIYNTKTKRCECDYAYSITGERKILKNIWYSLSSAKDNVINKLFSPINKTSGIDNDYFKRCLDSYFHIYDVDETTKKESVRDFLMSYLIDNWDELSKFFTDEQLEKLRLSREKSSEVDFKQNKNQEEVELKESKVEHPSHYNRENSMECIDEMILVFGIEKVKTFCLLNVWKYRYRAADKNGVEDLKKSDWYMKKYKELDNKNTIKNNITIDKGDVTCCL